MENLSDEIKRVLQLNDDEVKKIYELALEIYKVEDKSFNTAVLLSVFEYGKLIGIREVIQSLHKEIKKNENLVSQS